MFIPDKMPKVETFDKIKVINQALDVFHSKGYNLTSMQDIVDATGLNRSSIYNTFGNKLDLYKACLLAYKQQSKKVLNNSITKSNCTISKLKSIFHLGISSDKEYLRKGCLFNSCTAEMANQEDSVKQILLANNTQMINLFSSIIKEGQQNGLINMNKTNREYSLYLLTSFQGLRISGVLMDDKKELENIVHTVLSILN